MHFEAPRGAIQADPVPWKEVFGLRPFSAATATWFGIGLLPGPTGTWGSLAACVICEAFYPFLGLAPIVLLALLAILAGIPAATRISALRAAVDPKEVVVDEVAGQAIALAGFHAAFPLLAGPLAWGGVAAAFFGFRLLDIVKPGPIGALERLPGGTGIVLDDVAAGVAVACGFGLLSLVLPR